MAPTRASSFAPSNADKTDRLRSWQLSSLLCNIIYFSLLIPEQAKVIDAKATTNGDMKVIWSEDFHPCKAFAGCVNGLNASVWSFEEGNGWKYGPYVGGWGNNEVQCYTNRTENVRAVRKVGTTRGVLEIDAQFHDEPYSCYNPGAGDSTHFWTSARLITRGKVAFMPNATHPIKIEARVKIPLAWGAWPAFWMLPDTNRTDCLGCGAYGNGWCISGEIDIMETVNRGGLLQSTVHYGGLKDANYLNCAQAPGTFNASADAAAAIAAAGPHNLPSLPWTRVSVVWAADNITFYVNDTATHTVTSDTWYTGAVDKTAKPRAPFDQPFYLVVNLAVGGYWPTSESGNTLITDTRKAPYKFLVDWIRVYQ